MEEVLDIKYEDWVGLWRWDTDKCENAFEYYRFWGTLTDEEAQDCATSVKEFWHTEVLKDRLTLLFNAKDTTRDAQFSYEILIDGLPHEIPPLLRERANNSIKLNPTGMWTHTWQADGTLLMTQSCVVRGQPLQHSVRRVLNGDLLRAEELIDDADGRPVLRACHAYTRVPDAESGSTNLVT